jgi:DNA-binding PadR family transcriptional regulator
MSPRPSGIVTSSILQAIDRGYRYGADVMEATGQGAGTVYKVLRRLEGRGLIRGTWEDADVAERERRPRRRYYRLTAAGRTELAEAVERYRVLAAKPAGRQAPARGR